MLLYLVQHGQAKSKEQDPDRPLTDVGRRAIEALAELLGRWLEVRVNRIVHSGKTRATQTAEILATAGVTTAVEMEDALEPMAEPGLWADRLRLEPEDLMLVGHMPHLGRLGALLLSGDADPPIVAFQQGAILCLARDKGAWSIRWMVPPDVLSAAGNVGRTHREFLS